MKMFKSDSKDLNNVTKDFHFKSMPFLSFIFIKKPWKMSYNIHKNILNCNNISQYYSFYIFFAQINSAFSRVRDKNIEHLLPILFIYAF